MLEESVLLTGDGTFAALDNFSNLGEIDLGMGSLTLTGTGRLDNTGVIRGSGEIAHPIMNSQRGRFASLPGTGNIGRVRLPIKTWDMSR